MPSKLPTDLPSLPKADPAPPRAVPSAGRKLGSWSQPAEPPDSPTAKSKSEQQRRQAWTNRLPLIRKDRKK